MYASERQRTVLKEQVADVNEWLATLEITVTAEALGPANLQRATQLLNKTNQMNLSTRRLSEGELDAWLREHPHRQCWTFRVGDRFGDAGLTGIASLEVEDDTAVIVDFLLSCRVMGRRVEEAILHVVTRYALAAGAATIKAEYQATPKNQPCLEFWKKSGWNQVGDTFLWNKTTPYPAPHCVRINCPELAHA